MLKLIKIFAGILAAAILFLVAAPLAITQFVNPNDYKGEITAKVKEATGRELTIGGDINLTFFPWLGAEVSEIVLGNAAGFSEPTFARIDKIQVRVKLLPLLSKNLEMDTVTVDGLVLNLERTKDGTSNWDDLAKAGKPTDDAGAQSVDGKSPDALAALAIGGVDLRGAHLSWRDAAAGQHVQVSNMQAKTGAITLGQPLTVSLALDIKADSPAVSGHIETATEVTLDLDKQIYLAKGLTVQTTLSGAAIPGGSTSLALAGDVTFNGANQTIDVSGLKLDSKGVAVAGLKADAVITGAVHGDLVKQLFSVTGLNTAATVSGATIPGGSVAFSLRSDVRADLAAQTLAATGVKLDVPALKLDGASGNLTVAANLATKLDGQDIAITDFRGSGAMTGAKLQGATLRYDAKADLDIDLAKGNYRATGLTIAGSMSGGKVPGGEMPFAVGADVALTEQLTKLVIDKLRIAAADIKASGNLNVKQPLGEPTYQGTLAVAQLNPRQLLQLLGQPVPETSDAKTLTALTLKTDLSGGLNKVSLKGLDMTLDDTRLSGSLDLPSFDGKGLRFDLKLDKLNADRYLPPRKGTQAPATPASAAAAGVALPVEMLRALDIKGRLQAGDLTVSGLKLRDVDLGIDAKQGVIAVTPLKANLYDGKYAGNVRLDASGKTARVTLDENVTGVRADQLLADLGIKLGELDLKGGKSTLSLGGTASGDPATNQYTVAGLKLKADVAGKSFPGGRLKAGLGGDMDIDLNKQTLAARTLNASFGDLNADGKLVVTELLGDPRFAGTLKVAKFNPRELLAALGQPPIVTADKTALKSAELTSTFTGSTNSVDLKSINMRLDDSKLDGSLSVDNFAKPAIRYALTVDAFDADRYLPPSKNQPVATPGAAAAAAPTDTLRDLNVDGQIRVGQFKISNLRLSDVHFTTNAKDGLITIHPAGANLYQGVYAGDIRIDARGKQPMLSLNETLTNVQSGPLLKDLQGQAVLTGLANVSAKLTATGGDADAIKRTLTGDTKVSFANGSIQGVDILGKMCNAFGGIPNINQLNKKSLLTGLLGLATSSASSQQEGNETQFAELGGSIRFDKGIARNSDLSMKSPLLRVTGEGEADLPNNTVRYVATAALVSSCEGQGGQNFSQLAGFPIPVIIKGPLDAPKFYPKIDPAEIIAAMGRGQPAQPAQTQQQQIQQPVQQPAQQQQAPQTTKEIKKQIVEDVLKKALGGLFN